MSTFAVVSRSDARRTHVEDEIRAIYWQRFRAQPAPFPETLLALSSPSGSVDCAAGIRFGTEPFFSECYLDEPADVVLGRHFGRPVVHSKVIEVCNLAANVSGRSLTFVVRVIEFADLSGADWAIFTATRPLRLLLERSGLALVDLTPARQHQVRGPSNWGTYYDFDPWVVAVDRKAALQFMRRRSARYQAAVEADAPVL